MSASAAVLAPCGDWFTQARSSTMPLAGGTAVEPAGGDVTELLRQVGSGSREAEDRLFRLIYPKLRKLAAVKMAGEKPGHTLTPTALVAEAYLKLADQLGVPWKNRSQFLAVAALMMRRVLVDHWKKKMSEKSGGGWERVPLAPGLSLRQTQAEELLALHSCLERLEKEYPRAAKIVELHYFGGLSNPEIAEQLGISLSTVEADWRFARAWLRVELEGTKNEHPSRAKGAGAGAV